MNKTLEVLKGGGINQFSRTMRDYNISPKDSKTLYDKLDEIGESSGGSGEGNIEYLDVREKPFLEWGETFAITAHLVKTPTKISTMALLLFLGETVNDATAFAIDPTIEFDWQGSRITAADFYSSMGVDISTYPRITKEQFYSLN